MGQGGWDKAGDDSLKCYVRETRYYGMFSECLLVCYELDFFCNLSRLLINAVAGFLMGNKRRPGSSVSVCLASLSLKSLCSQDLFGIPISQDPMLAGLVWHPYARFHTCLASLCIPSRSQSLLVVFCHLEVTPEFFSFFAILHDDCYY
jgi:hypothetical protein